MVIFNAREGRFSLFHLEAKELQNRAGEQDKHQASVVPSDLAPLTWPEDWTHSETPRSLKHRLTADPSWKSIPSLTA